MDRKRVGEIDYLKSVCILLMIAFHLVFFSDKYPLVKQWVYTFHMPVFLILSGYLMRIEKPPREFLRAMGWIFIPYLIMETGYVVMSAVLPVRDKVDALSIGLVFDKLFLHPMGPYWYLHTFLLCGLTYYGVFRRLGRMKLVSCLLLLGTIYAVLADICHIVSLPNAMYFLAGVTLRRSETMFTSFFRPSLWALVPLAWLSTDVENLDCFTWGGVAIVYLVVSVLLKIYAILPLSVKCISDYIGAHTLILLVFSPVFTMLSKVWVPYLSFDSTGMLFLVVSVPFTVFGSFGVAWCIDRLGLSPWFWGKRRMLAPFRE
ncbi:acyltransferase [uncultured Phocaeicola sp.]|uniref:acyltransferase family protein n=1 Tax=uncultured Phocaeicola sp. TaxID=990718 RepID=UPI0025F9CD56|nr:acyltransferase [uncultured Phocaeicola sp.]